MTITVARRFRGPSGSGNGGYTAGLLAERLLRARPVPGGESSGPAAAVRVRLHVPPPLDAPLEVEVDAAEGSATLWAGSTAVATATWSALEAALVPPVPYDEVARRTGPYEGATDHPFPGCFVCGPDRADGDGLRLFPGGLGPGNTACTWRPDASVVGSGGTAPAEIVWAALDCPGGWSSGLNRRPMVLGTMTAEVLRLPRVDERCVVVGRLDHADDRRSSTSTALYVGTTLLARAEAIWVRVDPAVFNRLAAPQPQRRASTGKGRRSP